MTCDGVARIHYLIMISSSVRRLSKSSPSLQLNCSSATADIIQHYMYNNVIPDRGTVVLSPPGENRHISLTIGCHSNLLDP